VSGLLRHVFLAADKEVAVLFELGGENGGSAGRLTQTAGIGFA
jgi:hypothetical protein